MDEMLFWTAEMGVKDIVPVLSERVFGVAKKQHDENVRQRWQVRAKAFMRNSLREVCPVVHPTTTFDEAVKLAKDYDVAILAYENESDPLCTKKALESCKNAKSVIIFIGCEQGFTPEEVELAKSNGVKIVTLGKRIIRAVNAGAVLMGMLVYELELCGGVTDG
jgi:16S rRNA (uracil1498-N3)-methyltransferase